MPVERRADVVPRSLPRELEVMETGEEAKREIPVQVRRERTDPRILREPATQFGIERRAAAAVDRLPAEDLRLPRYFGAAASADFACSTISLNLPGSVAARSASTFRSSSTFAIFKPDMN